MLVACGNTDGTAPNPGSGGTSPASGGSPTANGGLGSGGLPSGAAGMPTAGVGGTSPGGGGTSPDGGGTSAAGGTGGVSGGAPVAGTDPGGGVAGSLGGSAGAGGMTAPPLPPEPEDPNAAGYVWRNVVVGGGGFVTGIHFHPTTPGLVYLRTDMGGAYRWEPERSRWKPLTDALGRDEADFMGVLSLALDPNDPERVYLMTGKYTQSWAGMGALLRSNDRGETWTRFALPFKVGGNEDGRGAGERLEVDPHLGSRLVMGTTRDGLWESTNGGESFTKISSFSPTNVSFVAFHAASGAAGMPTPRLFVGVANTTASLWHSQDGGATWAEVAGQPTGVMAVRAAIAGNVLYLTYANVPGPNDATTGDVYRYAVDTGTWTKITPSTGMYGFSGISLDPANPDHVIVSTLDRWAPGDEVYRSTDGGASFTPLLAGATWDYSVAPYAKDSNPHWLADAKLDPHDPSRLLFVTGYGVFGCRGIDTPTRTCAFESAGIEQTVPLQIASPPEGAPLLSAMGDIDGFVHADLGVSPPAGRHRPLKGTTRSIAFAEAAPLSLVKTFDAVPYGARSIDGGTTWTDFATFPAGAKGGGTRSIAISADGTAIVWGPQDAALAYSHDAGSTWTPSQGGVPTGTPPIADRVDPAIFYAFDPIAGTVYASTDRGATFEARASGLPAVPDWAATDGMMAAVPGHAGHLWLTAREGGLFRSVDAGATFQKVAAASAAFRVGFGRAADGASYPAIYVWATIGGTTGIFRSTDEGQSFVRVNDDRHQYGWIHEVVGDPRVFGRVYLATEGRGVVYGEPAD
ncbi:MAG: hypothetical protein DIU78_017725 [Pseudomonadota bacterium]